MESTKASGLTYRFAGVVVDPAGFRLTVAGEARAIEPKSFRLLCFLIENRERAVDKDEIFRAVWPDAFVTDNALTRAIAQIRKSIGDDPKQPRFIETVPTVGYRFCAPVEMGESAPATAIAPSERPRSWRAWKAGALALAVLAAAGFAAWKLTGRPPARTFSTAQFSTSDGLDIGATFSPDGKLVAYASDRTGQFEIYVKSFESGGKDLQLTNDGNQNMFPSFSPDGRLIAFSSMREKGIRRVSVLGGATRRLTNFGGQPAWSPDGTRIVFMSDAPVSQSTTDYYFGRYATLWMVGAEGGEPKQITKSGEPLGRQSFPSWSADGKEVRFVGDWQGESAIWSLAPADGTLRKLLSSYKVRFGSATFSPDNRKLWFINSNLNGDIGIWQSEFNPSTPALQAEPQPVYVPSLGVPRDLSISPDGKHILFSAILSDSKLMKLTMAGARSDGKEPVVLTHEVGYRYALPQISPDRQFVSFTRWEKNRHARVWVMGLDGGQPSPVGSDTDLQNVSTFSKDGKSLYYTTRSAGRNMLMNTNLADGLTRAVAELPQNVVQSITSPDGREMVYHLDGEIPFEIWKQDIGTGARTRLTSGAENMGYARFSPDGKWLSFEILGHNKNQIAVMPSSGGKTEILYESEGPAYSYGWSADGDKISFAGFVDGAWNIYWVSRSTHKTQKLTDYRGMRSYARYPAWSSDGKTMVYEFNEPKGNVFVGEWK